MPLNKAVYIALNSIWYMFALKIKDKDTDLAVLGRGEAYTGVLIDDLVTKGVKEPCASGENRAV